jgi:hypothetical protein
MHIYKSIYTYAYMLCNNRFVVIFVVIVWKTTLNTRKKLKRDYLRGLFEGIIWGRSFEKEETKKKYLIREDETEYWESWDKTWTNRQVLLIEILSNRVVCLNISFRLLLSNISSSSFSSQMISLKWSTRIIPANNLF